jgi:DNA-binding CsgD family transcriptional regulator
MAHGIAASVLAGRGRFEPARAHLRAGEQAMAASHNGAATLWLVTARARVAAAGGDHEAVVATLSPLATRLRSTGLPEGVQPWRADLVDALVALDRLDAATAELSELSRRLTSGGAHARAGAARARGTVLAARGDDEAAAAAFGAGLAEDAEATGAFARGRLELAAGAFERRRGRRRAAAALLDDAIARLTALDAAPYLERARRERDACGLTPRRQGRGELTTSERNVAALVAAGHTNREVANRLVVSVKTVETHLARVFDKIGVRSRTELANAWHGAGDERASSPPGRR